MDRRMFLLASGSAAGVSLIGLTASAKTLDYERFSVFVQGSGSDVIFVPGLTCSRDVWSGVVARLGGKYRTHLVQVAGFAGAPVKTNARGDVCAGVAEGLAGYIADQRLARPAIIGHSMGGTIAMMIAARHPSAVGKAMIVDMFPDIAIVMVGPAATPQQVRAAAEGIRASMTQTSDAKYRATQTKTVEGMILTPSARPAVINDGLKSDRGVVGRAMSELVETDLRPELSRITASVTVLYAWNKDDPFTAAQVDQLMRESYSGLKGVKLIRVDDSAHFIFLDQPARFDAHLQTFLKA